ncbi:DNA polymerase epsilon catalytic subunit A isoform X1 [Arachis hypogaea]|uniref:DNA polymerase epsilon catalytic subunit A isoform X1 n=1 Tax=Arachis hypogaea TaxID=3818 RepID=UPI000DEDF6D4
MAKKSDYYHIKKQIESDFVDGANVRLSKSFLDLSKTEQQSRLKDRLKKYCQKIFERKLTISCPCVMLNVDVAINNTNDQYLIWINQAKR